MIGGGWADNGPHTPNHKNGPLRGCLQHPSTPAYTYRANLLLCDVRRCVEEVQYFSRRLYAVLLRCVWGGEAVVPGAHVIHKGQGTVWELVWVRNVLEERLLGKTKNING